MEIQDPGLAKTALIRELVDLSRFTEGILRNLDSGVVAVGRDGCITYLNPAGERLLGRPARELLGRPAAEVLSTRSGERLLPEPEEEGISGEVDLLLEDGRQVTVDVRLSRPAEGEAGLVAILTDRTELRRAEEESRRKERLASLGELSAGVAHEIRNPLAGIGATAQLLGSRIQEKEKRQLVELILGEVARLDRIVESMLQFARPSRPNLRQEDLCSPLGRALDLVRREAEESGVVIATDFPQGIPPVWIDPDQMEQVFLNLFRNSIQAMPEGGTLAVALRLARRRPYLRRTPGRRKEDRGRIVPADSPLHDWVQVEVKDTGQGIPPEEQDRVFDPFHTTRKQGTGLGLSIAQAIVQEHGGGLSLTSEPGHGTTVWVDLPRDKRRGRRRRPGGET
jgi:PAS domain S-box-containing protein